MRLLILALVLCVASPAIADPQSQAIEKVVTALKLQDLFRYRASKEYLIDGMRLADQAGLPEIWILGAELYAVAMSLTGDHASAMDVTTAALDRIAKNPALRKHEEGFLEIAGVLEFKLKRPERALQILGKLREAQRARNDRKGELGTMHHQAYAYSVAGDYARALSLIEAILASRADLAPEVVPTVMQSHGKFLQEIGEHTKSLEVLTQALAIVDDLLSKTPVPPEPNLETHFKGSDQDPGFPARHRYRSLRINRADILASLGAYYDFVGDYQTALVRYQDAVDLERTLMISGTRKDELFDIARRLVIIYKKRGNLKKAFGIINAVKSLAESNAIPTTDIELTYGELVLGLIANTDEGKAFATQAIDIFERNDRPDLLGVVSLKQRRFAEAKQQFAAAMKKALATREADKFVGTFIGAGLAAEGLGELEAAERFLNKSILLMENQRDTLSASDRSAFFAGEVIGLSRTLPYEALVRVYGMQKQVDYAYWASENLKARHLSEAIAEGRKLDLTLPSTERERELALDQAISKRVRDLEDAFRRSDRAAHDEIERELGALRAERDVFVEALRKTHPGYASIRYPRPLTPTELWLGRDEVLVEFEVTADDLFIFVVADGKSRLLTRKIGREQLRLEVGALREAFSGVTSAADLGRFNPDKAASLYRTLFDGVFDGIAAEARVVIVPDEFLALLPFDALVAEGQSKQTGQNAFGPFPLGVRYLGEKRALSYAQSGTSLTIARTLQNTSGAKRILVAADPVFSINDPRAAGAAASESSAVLEAMNEWKTMGVAGSISRTEAAAAAAAKPVAEPDLFPRLEKTSLLAASLRATFAGDAAIYLAKDAKESTVKAADLRDYRFLLFATHGILDNTLPYVREPALVMSLVGNPNGDDGFLTASEVMRLKLNAEVVALTACQTGVGKNVSGEGVMGLGRAFEYAGARSVLMSLWSVSEDSTTLLAGEFFRYLKQGQDAARALANARQDIRKKGYENPFYWAAFTLMGAGTKPTDRMTVASNGALRPVAERAIGKVLSELEAEASTIPPPAPRPSLFSTPDYPAPGSPMAKQSESSAANLWIGLGAAAVVCIIGGLVAAHFIIGVPAQVNAPINVPPPAVGIGF